MRWDAIACGVYRSLAVIHTDGSRTLWHVTAARPALQDDSAEAVRDLEIARSWWDPKFEKGRVVPTNLSLHWFLEEDKEAKEREVGGQEGQEEGGEDLTPKAPEGGQALSGTPKGGRTRASKKEDEAGPSQAPSTAEKKRRADAPTASPQGKKARQGP